MTELIACFSAGEATRKHVIRLIQSEQWEKVIILTDIKTKSEIPNLPNTEIITISPEHFLPELTEDIKNSLKNKIIGPEVAINFISGTGKEHMALLSALLKLGLGIRLVALTTEGVREI